MHKTDQIKQRTGLLEDFPNGLKFASDEKNFHFEVRYPR